MAIKRLQDYAPTSNQIRVCIGGISCLVTLAVLVLCGAIITAGMFTNVQALIVVGAVLEVPELLVTGLLNSAVNGIFQASLYSFVMAGDAGPTIDTELVREAFQAG